jgi:hypothetical protein
MFSRTLLAGLLATTLAVASGLTADRPAGLASQVSEARYLEHVKYLASDELGGRGNGTPGLERAARYIADQFRASGLQPGMGDGSWFQPFEIVTGLDVHAGNTLVLRRGGRDSAFSLGDTYYPLSVGARAGTLDAAEVTMPVVFAGYGISAPELGYDDYAGVDVRDAAVVVFMHEPQEHDPDSPFEGRAFTQHASLMQKAMVARGRGARLMLLVIDPSHDTDDGAFSGWVKDPQADNYGLTVVRVERGRLAESLGPAIDLGEAARQIDADLKPRSRALPGVEVRSRERFSQVRREVRNVIGILPGTDPARAHEAVVVGAHYDHLGLGGRHSLAPDAHGEIHNGADDNASGTAALIEIARVAAASRERFPRTMVFIAFAGEELGLLGSAYYVEHPVVPLDRTTAMLNLDMMGRPDGQVLVSGTDSAPALVEDVEAAAAGRSIKVNRFREGAGVGSSDDTSFLLRRVPAIGFFSGFHADYHRPSDDWERLDLKGAVEVTRLALALAERLSARGERPAFTGTPQPARQGTSGGSGYGAYFGSVPDFGEDTAGVTFADVRAGSPAEQAGLRPGDVLVEFDGAPVATIYDFTHALRNKRPGDTVTVVVVRSGERVTAEVTLGRRQ